MSAQPLKGPIHEALTAPALTRGQWWLSYVAQTEDSPVDVNLDAAAARGGPIATHARAPVMATSAPVLEPERHPGLVPSQRKARRKLAPGSSTSGKQPCPPPALSPPGCSFLQ